MAAAATADSVDAYRARLRVIAAQSDVAGDATTLAAVRLAIVAPGHRRRPPADAGEILQAVIADTRLAGSPLRIAALVQLANLYAEAGDLASAQTTYSATGLNAQQCALVDARPAALREGTGAGFPDEVQRWGFEGWVKLEFDVLPDGRTTAQRATIAYPPLVFDDAAKGMARGWRYTQSYRPDGQVGCGGARQVIRFRLSN